MNLFACPICQAPLRRKDVLLRCTGSHSFDISREGYVNLLPAHHRKSRLPGDNAEMVAARRRILAEHHFEPLVTALRTEIEAKGTVDRLVDIGCGEGSITASFSSSVPQVYGVDVSKAAIRAAARQYKPLILAVSSSTRLPLLDKAFEVATVILAPFSGDISRVVETGGKAIRVTPGPDHLSQLKELIYRNARPHRRAVVEFPLLRHIGHTRIEFDLTLDRQSRTDFINMTPMRYRSNPALRIPANEPEQMRITADFWIDVFERTQ